MAGFDPAAMLQILGQGAINLPPQIAAQKRQKEQDALQQELIRLQMQGKRQDLSWNDPAARRQRAREEREQDQADRERLQADMLERIRAQTQASAANRQPTDPQIAEQRQQRIIAQKAQTAVQSVLRPGQAAYIANQSTTPQRAAEAMVANARRAAPDVPENIIRAYVYDAIESARNTRQSPGSGGGTNITRGPDGSITVNR